MKGNIKLIVIIILIVILIGGIYGGIQYMNYRKNLEITVWFNEQYFATKGNVHKYHPGDTVTVSFLKNEDGVTYAFDVVGVKNFETNYDDVDGYTITFQVGTKPISVYYEVVAIENGISIDLRENQTTGFIWEYTISNPDIITVIEDRYVVDEGEELSDGAGGAHYYTFKVVADGQVDITFDLMRDDEFGRSFTYRYDCQDGHAQLIEMIENENPALLESIDDIEDFEES